MLLTLLLSCLLGLPEAEAVPPSLAAGDLELPGPAPTLGQARTIEARLEHGAHRVPDGAPNVVVHAPAGLRPETATVVVYLHGWEGCARAVVSTRAMPCQDGAQPAAAWGLGDRHDDAGTNTVLVVPQLAWLARTGDAGRFGEPGFAVAWLTELTQTVLGPQLGLERVDDLVLVAHSGGYVTTLALLEQALPVRSVVLLDALYGGGDRVADWVAAASGRRAVSLHTPHPGTSGQSRLLARRAAASLGQQGVVIDPPSLGAAVSSHRVTVSASPHSHGAIPAAHLAELLAGLRLGQRG